MKTKRLTLKILFLLIFSDVLETAVHLCFKRSVIPLNSTQINDFQSGFIFLYQAASSPYLWLGLIVAATIFIIWSSVLSKIDLSVAVPIASSSYIFVPIASIIFLHEKVSFLRWVGILFIIAGVIFVSLSSKDGERELAK
ncbi:MAG: EamA family transporter [Candidatus Omnitrophica bacterium]|nr:EamA family transporter [Candidatus Omnitrophota bacterium]MBU1869499.1 EamA family transporter [Candidatus Omnitrophota bacterium]